jgi:hypothetical protein
VGQKDDRRHESDGLIAVPKDPVERLFRTVGERGRADTDDGLVPLGSNAALKVRRSLDGAVAFPLTRTRGEKCADCGKALHDSILHA